MSNGVNGIKYQVGGVLPSGAQRIGNYIINPYALGPTDSTEFWNTYEVPVGQYTIYVYKGTSVGGPAIYYCQNDSELIFITNQISGNNFTTVAQCETYFNSQTDRILVPGRSNVRIMIPGGYDTINTSTRNFIGRTFFWGETDTAWPSVTGPGGAQGFDAASLDLKAQSTGKQIVVGSFTTYNGTSEGRICRLNVDGSLDATFNSSGSGFNDTAVSVWINSDDSILVVGNFTTYNGVSANRIVKLTPNGDIDGSFSYGTGFNAEALVVEKRGNSYYIGGKFTTYKGVSYLNFIVLNETGGVLGPSTGNGSDLSVIPNVSEIRTIQVSSDGSFVYIGGVFDTWNGSDVATPESGYARGGIAKISTSTWSLDSTFKTNIGYGVQVAYDDEGWVSTGGVRAILLDETLERLYVGHSDSSFNLNPSLAYLLALNLDGSTNSTFNNNKTAPNNYMNGIVASNVYPNYIYIFGSFTDYGGNTGRDRLAVLTRDGDIVESNVCSVYGGPNQEPQGVWDFVI